MIAAWILYTVGVGFLASVAALAGEHLLRAHRRPARWVWAGAVLVSAAWPLGLWGWTHRPPTPGPVLPEAVATQAGATPTSPVEAPGAAIRVAPDSSLRSLDGPILTGWMLAAATLAFLALVLAVRIGTLRRRWRTARVAGRQVLVADAWGPAVVGVLRPRIVVPAWSLELEPEALELVLAHEEEHLRAGDLRLLAGAGALAVLAPWHLPLWWQLFRLRAAVEGDCDLRVLSRHAGRTRDYIDLLLRVGGRGAGTASASRGPALFAALLSQPFHTLARRIRIMTMPHPKRPWLRGGLLAAAALLAVALACTAPPPSDVGTEPDAAAIESAADAAAPDDEASYPTFTPFTLAPNGDNPGEVAAFLEGEYAGLDGRPTGRVDVWYFVTEDGRVQDTRVARSSGSPELDELALRAATEWRFTPARNRDQPRAVWVSLPVVFGPGDTGNPRDPDASPAPAPRVVAGPAPDEVASRRSDADAGGRVGVVTGTVRDVASGRPLPFAQVFVPGTGRGTLADAEGRFRVEGVPVGEHTVAVQLVGYRESRADAAVGAGSPTEIEFPLQATASRLQGIRVDPGG